MISKTSFPPRILVIGAGAAGLAFALACAHRGVRVEIIDKRPARSLIQKATGVAQGVWRQLAPFGITASIIHDAFPMRRFVFHDDGRLVADVPVPSIDGQPPAHLYPQGELEKFMEDCLHQRGVTVEYGASFVSVSEADGVARVRIARETGGIEEIDVDWLIGADGVHSDVRTQLQIPFVGRDYPEDWSVAEISTAQWPEHVHAQLFLGSDGVGLFLSRPTKGIVQGILNGVGAAGALTTHFPDATLHYERNFKVSLRRVETPRRGRTWLVGDAAHAQSPVGGQGLNLAIWDGITLANALLDGDLSVERRLAWRARRVLFFTDFDYRMLATRSKPVRMLRNLYWAGSARRPFLAHWFFKVISGVW